MEWGSRKSKPRRPRRPMGLQARVRELEMAVKLAVREALLEIPGSEEAFLGPFKLELSLSVEPGDQLQIRLDGDLGDRIREAVREQLASKVEAFRPGHLYCHRCESFACEHSLPPGPGSVFGGYTPTGLPRWVDFHQLLLEMRHPRLEELFEPDGRGMLAAYLDGPSLKTAQLEVFGRLSKTYDLLGQVTFGFLRVGSERLALTAQAVEFRASGGSSRLELNLLGCLPEARPPWEALERPHQERVRDLLVEARRQIRNMSPRRRRCSVESTSSNPVNQWVERILRALARRLDGMGRQMRRRTVHAEVRREERRATCKAWEDAACAPRERILWDASRKTVVVLGRRHRVHVFSPEGKHITSLVMNREEVQSRMRRNRWTVPDDELLDRFRLAFNGASREHGAPGFEDRSVDGEGG